ncbi:MAG: polyphosphate kinase 1 [Anaerolineales bacterium]
MPAKKAPPELDLDNPALYINREVGLLNFQFRVLEEAQDPTTPLLERIKFIAILGSNMDEFFMVRVGGLQLLAESGVLELSNDGLTPAEQLADIRKLAANLMEAQRTCLQKEILPALREQGIFLLDYDELNETQKNNADRYFHEVVFPILTPLGFDPGHPFPHISNLSLNLGVLIRTPDGNKHFVRIKVPNTLPRLVPLKRSSGSVRRDGTVPHNHYFVWLEQLIAAHLDDLLPGMEILAAHPFRVTRNADQVIQELEASDLLETMEQSVRQRRFGDVVRLSINPGMSSEIRAILFENLHINANDVYTVNGPLGLCDLMTLLRIDRYDLKAPPFVPALSVPIHKDHRGGIFQRIDEGDILLHHPYDSFDLTVEFLQQAASSPDVLAIKQTLYRVGSNAPVVRCLLEAQENRKQVAVLVELKARFDEESNIGWARVLEQEGVHVTYGLLGLKTHCKIALVVYQKEDHIRRYVHLATGNYNAVTARIYEDLALFTADPDLGADATDLFNYLTGYSNKRDYRKLLVSPINLRAGLEDRIRREIAHAQAGKPAYLVFKTNALVDRGMIQRLYQASVAGVHVELLVRGICCLLPGIPNVSENIRVTSILGRFLEHSRIYYFHNDGNPEILLGSADLMPRNLDRRVEILFPVENAEHQRYICDDVLAVALNDNTSARQMQPDGSYVRLRPLKDQPQINLQRWLLQEHSGEKPHPLRFNLLETLEKRRE